MNSGPVHRKNILKPLGLTQGLLIILALIFILLINSSQLAEVLKIPIILLTSLNLIGLLFICQKKFVSEKEQEKQIEDYQQLKQQTNERIEAILKISQQFAAAREEQQIIDLSLQLFMNLLNTRAAVFTPFDEHGQTLPAKVLGVLPQEISRDWLEYLSSPSVRSKCPNCQKIEQLTFDCPLLLNSMPITGVYCAPVRRADQELGIFHFFLPDKGQPSIGDKQRPTFSMVRKSNHKKEFISLENESFIRLIAEQTALALESARLKSREERIVAQLSSVHEKMDMGKFIQALVESANHGINGGGTIIKILDKRNGQTLVYQSGKLDEYKGKILESLIQRVIDSGEMILVGENEKDNFANRQKWSGIGIPIRRDGYQLQGVLACYSEQRNGFSDEQILMLKAIAAQVNLILQNSDNLAELEYEAILQERVRLAREIHDGLAQTLGFLKLRLSQLQMYLEKGEQEKTKQTVQQLYQTVANAYIETRATIDQLRLPMEHNNLEVLLNETIQEFTESSGIEGVVQYKVNDAHLPGEVNAQLIRIVQESLSNVRKHSHASVVRIYCYSHENELIIEISDNGVGFEPQEIHGRSEYGLRGMKERAEIIGADIKIFSQLGQGTTVQIKLPVTYLEGKMEK